ncbi:hypothetical protein Chor_004993 [Crotalus horridus]
MPGGRRYDRPGLSRGLTGLGGCAFVRGRGLWRGGSHDGGVVEPVGADGVSSPPSPPEEGAAPLGPADVGNRGETVFVHRSFGRNHLLRHNRAVYASPENKKFFEEENRLRQEGKLPRLQSHSGMKLGVVVPPQALTLPEEPITRLGSYWCEVTVNGLDTVRVPLSVQQLAEPKSNSQRLWLAQKEPDAEREV